MWSKAPDGLNLGPVMVEHSMRGIGLGSPKPMGLQPIPALFPRGYDPRAG